MTNLTRNFISILIFIFLVSGTPLYAMKEYRHKISFGTTGQIKGSMDHPLGIVVDEVENIYLTDWKNKRVQIFRTNGEIIRAFPVRPRLSRSKWGPTGITLDKNGKIYVVDQDHNKIKKYSRTGELLNSFGRYGTWKKRFRSPRGINIDRFDNIFVADSNNYRVQKFSLSGKYLGEIKYVQIGNMKLSKPWGVCSDSKGNLFVTYPDIPKIVKYDRDGNILKEIDNKETFKMKTPRYICMDNLDNLYISDFGTSRIIKLDPDLKLVSVIGDNLDSKSRFTHPEGITVDFSGNLYVADSGNNRIIIFEPPEKVKHLNWAHLYTSQGNFLRASEEFEKVLNLDSGVPEIKEKLIYSLIRNGQKMLREENKTEAISSLKKVKELDPLNAYAIRELRDLEGIPVEKQKKNTRELLIVILLSLSILISFIMSVKS